MSEWVSVEDKMPEDAFGCLVVVDDTEPMTGAEFLSILPYFVGWDGDRWNDYDGKQCPFEVRYWMPLPEVPEEEEETIVTNADIIRAMSDEELAEFLEGPYGNMVTGSALKWLKEEAEAAARRKACT